MTRTVTFSMMCDALDSVDGISNAALKKNRRNKLNTLRQAKLIEPYVPEDGEAEYVKKDLFTFATMVQAGLLLQFAELSISYSEIDKLNNFVRPQPIGKKYGDKDKYQTLSPSLSDDRDILEQVIEKVSNGEAWRLEIVVTRSKNNELAYRGAYVRNSEESPFATQLISAFDSIRGDRYLEVRQIAVTRLIRDLLAEVGD